MIKIGLVDDLFLRLESPRQPLHIGILMLFEPPARCARDFVKQLDRRLRQSTKTAAPFNRRLVVRRGMHYWEEDEEFDLENHVVYTSLPHPGRIRELLALVSRVHCGHLDRAYPLWRMYLIEGLEDGRFAVYMKMHHALVDGMAGMRLLLKSMSPNAAESITLPPPWEVQTRKSENQPPPVPSAAALGLPALFSMAQEGVQAIAPVLKELRSTYDDARAHNPDLTMYGTAPKSLFNTPISATRRFAAQSYSTARIKAVAQEFDATVNDVVLAMCGSALRHYLQDMHELPEKPLSAAVPVSVRRPGSDAANEVAFTMTNLATDLKDPAARLRAIKGSMDYNKARLQRLSSGQVIAYTAMIMIPGRLKALLGRAGDSELGNVVISHVPGPRRDMFWQGARLSGLYPISLNKDGLALNITLVSRHDFVDFGLIACRKAVPSVQRMLDYLEEGLAELEATIKPTRSPAKTRAKPRKGQAKPHRKAQASRRR